MPKKYILRDVLILNKLPTPTKDSSYKDSFYYINPVNVWNSPHHNALPSQRDLDSNEVARDYAGTISGGVVRKVTDGGTDINLNGTLPKIIGYEKPGYFRESGADGIGVFSDVSTSRYTSWWSKFTPVFSELCKENALINGNKAKPLKLLSPVFT